MHGTDGSWFEFSLRAVMSNPNGLLSQKACRYLDQGHTLKDILMRAVH